jgi:hypothetical protein
LDFFEALVLVSLDWLSSREEFWLTKKTLKNAISIFCGHLAMIIPHILSIVIKAKTYRKIYIEEVGDFNTH